MEKNRNEFEKIRNNFSKFLKRVLKKFQNYSSKQEFLHKLLIPHVSGWDKIRIGQAGVCGPWRPRVAY